MNQDEMLDDAHKDIEELKKALSQLVYKDAAGVWRVGIKSDEDVSDVIGSLLD